MQRVIIICEGETEREFCTTILSPYFANRGIHIQAPLIKKSMGGIVKWAELKKQIALHLKNDPSAHVTMLIDYYGLYEKHEFPNWEAAENEPDRNRRMDILEEGMSNDITDALRYRYIPYIQLHEFEGLLFSDIAIFYQQIPPDELVNPTELQQTFRDYANPELINNNPDTSPSHRLERIIAGYNKVVYGNILAEAIGLTKIKEKCPRFNHWLTTIEGIVAPSS